MDGFAREVGLESVGMKVRSEIGGMGGDLFFDSREGVGGDGKSAAGEERGERGGGMDLGRGLEFTHGVEGCEDVAAAGIGENTEQRRVGVVPGDGAGAADREDGAVPRGGHTVGRGDGGANS